MGNNSHGRLGNGQAYATQSTPIQIVESGVVDVSAGHNHTVLSNQTVPHGPWAIMGEMVGWGME